MSNAPSAEGQTDKLQVASCSRPLHGAINKLGPQSITWMEKPLSKRVAHRIEEIAIEERVRLRIEERANRSTQAAQPDPLTSPSPASDMPNPPPSVTQPVPLASPSPASDMPNTLPSVTQSVHHPPRSSEIITERVVTLEKTVVTMRKDFDALNNKFDEFCGEMRNKFAVLNDALRRTSKRTSIYTSCVNMLQQQPMHIEHDRSPRRRT